MGIHKYNIDSQEFEDDIDTYEFPFKKLNKDIRPLYIQVQTCLKEFDLELYIFLPEKNIYSYSFKFLAFIKEGLSKKKFKKSYIYFEVSKEDVTSGFLNDEFMAGLFIEKLILLRKIS